MYVLSNGTRRCMLFDGIGRYMLSNSTWLPLLSDSTQRCLLLDSTKRFMLANNTRKSMLSDGKKRYFLPDGTQRCMLSTNIHDVPLYTGNIGSRLISNVICTKWCIISIYKRDIFWLLAIGLCILMTGTRGASAY